MTTPSEYHEILIPDFDFGAKRPVLDHGYLAVLNNPRMELLQSDSMTVIGPRQIQVDDGRSCKADVVVLANGFKTQEWLVPMRIIGHDGAELPKIWQQEDSYAQAYMGVCVAGFPNLFLLTGPNTLPSGHSTLIGIECSVEYILRLISQAPGGFVPSNRVRIEVKSSSQIAFNEWIQSQMQRLVYTADVPNWYIDARSGRNTLIWPGSQLAFWWSRCRRRLAWEDFDVQTSV
ncbi:hypothetical protein ACHAQJ_007607 [Trichoderma viride]